jgi:epoxyqueuosine reductase
VSPSENAAIIRREALALGFCRVGFTPVGPVERHRLYENWIDRGFAGEMTYLVEQRALRRDPQRLFGRARTVVAVALSYDHPDPPEISADRLVGGPRGVVARYARGDDYHTVMKTKLYALGRALTAALAREVAYLPCVDTAPLLEREAAQASGLGFIAKNTLLIAPGAGSYLLLGELLVDVDCEPQPILEPRCGECRACLSACPTQAFVDAYTLDARRCISYLTIENPGPIPYELRPLIGDRVFGCDICQEVCPYNASVKGGAPELAPRPGSGRPALRRLLGLGAAQFRKWQRKSALRRIHRPQLLRNVAVALGNLGDVEDVGPLSMLLSSPSPLVRSHAVWALAEIARRDERARKPVAALLDFHVDEDPTVQEELARRRQIVF